MAASVREALAASFSQILRKLKAAGVDQKTIATAMNWDESIISQIKRGSYDPSLKTLEKLLKVLNRYATNEIQPSDLFRDPIDLLREEAERMGYDLTKRPTD